MNGSFPETWRECLLAVVLLMTTSGCHAPKSPVGRESEMPPPLPKIVADSLQTAIDILQSASAVESYRIDPVRGADVSRGILGYPVIARGPHLDKVAARQLKSLVLDPRGYIGDIWCGDIEPGVAFRIVSGERTLTILICFKCKEWEFWLNGKRVGGDYFIGLQPELLKLVQRVFPDDDSLKAIAPSETYGRIYRIDALRATRTVLSDDQRREIVDEWAEKIRKTVGDPDGWRDAGGTKHSLRATEDERGLIVITTANGHAAIELLDGIKVVPLNE